MKKNNISLKIIPEGWKNVSFGSVSSIYDGTHQTPTYVETGVPFYSVEHITSNNFNETKFVSEAVYLAESRRVKIEKGDVLMSRIGDIGTATHIDWIVRASFYVTLALIKIKNCKELNAKFLTYSINSETLRREIWKKTLHVAFPNKINLGDIKRCFFRLPPLPEQNRIVAVLDTCDQAIQKLSQKIEKKRNIKKGLMQELLTGKTRLPGFTEKWVAVELGDVSKMGSGGTPKSDTEEFYGGGISWVSIADMTANGKYIFKTLKTLSKKGLDNSAAKIYPQGTILYAMYASIGECSIACVEMTSSQAILGIMPNKETLDPMFLYYHLSFIKERIKLRGQQGTQSNLNAGMVRKFVLNIPSVNEQQSVVAIIEAADKEIKTLERKLKTLQEQKRYLLNNLITGTIRTPESLSITN